MGLSVCIAMTPWPLSTLVTWTSRSIASANFAPLEFDVHKRVLRPQLPGPKRRRLCDLAKIRAGGDVSELGQLGELLFVAPLPVGAQDGNSLDIWPDVDARPFYVGKRPYR